MAGNLGGQYVRPSDPLDSSELSRRRDGFESFLAERLPVLTDFIQRLQLPNPALVLVDAEKYVPSVDMWMKDQIVEPADFEWLLARLGYLIGEFFVQRFSGCWFLNEVPGSRYFGRYVVGRFVRAPNFNAMIDPLAVAHAYISEPPGRSLTGLLESVQGELAEA
jgi:hypothetical protein